LVFEGEETAGLGVAAARLEMGACFFAVVEVEVFEQLDGSSPERLMTAMTAIFETPIPPAGSIYHAVYRVPQRKN
jgi:hypothetical protein